MMQRGRTVSTIALAVYFWAIIAYLIFPIFVVIPLSFSGGDFLRFPPENVGLRWYREYLSDPVWIDATVLSLKIAFASSLLATVVGTMAVVVLERGAFRLKGLITAFVTAPIITPHIFIALGVFIIAIQLGFADNEVTLVGAHATISLPFVALIVGASIRQIDPTLERAARVLGAGPLRAFRAATLPSLLPAMVAAAVFSFFVSFDELIIAQFLMSSRETLPMRIWADLRLEISPTVAAVASLLVVATTLAMVGAELLRRRASANQVN